MENREIGIISKDRIVDGTSADLILDGLSCRFGPTGSRKDTSVRRRKGDASGTVDTKKSSSKKFG